MILKQAENPAHKKQGAYSMTAQNLAPQSTKDNLAMAEGLQHYYNAPGIKAMDMLAFLAEVMDGGGDGLTLTPDARDGLTHILKNLYSTVGEAIEAADMRHLGQ